MSKKKENKSQKIIGIIAGILIASLILFFLFYVLPRIDFSTATERAFDFCEQHNMLFSNEDYIPSCVVIEDDIVIDRKYLTYVTGIRNWAFVEQDKIEGGKAK